MMTSAVENAMTDNQAVESGLTFGATASSNQSVAEIRTTNVNRLVSSYTYSQFTSDVKSILAQQSITIDVATEGDVSISDISQYIKVELIGKQIADVMTATFSDISTETSSTTTKDTTQSTKSGLSSGAIVIIIIIIAIVAAIGAALWFVFGPESVGRNGAGATHRHKAHHTHRA